MRVVVLQLHSNIFCCPQLKLHRGKKATDPLEHVCLYSTIGSLTQIPGSGGVVKRTRMLLAALVDIPSERLRIKNTPKKCVC